jgi:hypothetical protein
MGGRGDISMLSCPSRVCADSGWMLPRVFLTLPARLEYT